MPSRYDNKEAFYRIVAGLCFPPVVNSSEVTFVSPGEWPTETRAEFWDRLFAELKSFTQRIIPPRECESSIPLKVNLQLTVRVPAADWEPSQRPYTIQRLVEQASTIDTLNGLKVQDSKATLSQSASQPCPVCACTHDPAFTRIVLPAGQVVDLRGAALAIFAAVHSAHARGAPHLEIKGDEIKKARGGYRHPSKPFYDLGLSDEYQLLFDTARPGFISLRHCRKGPEQTGNSS